MIFSKRKKKKLLKKLVYFQVRRTQIKYKDIRSKFSLHRSQIQPIIFLHGSQIQPKISIQKRKNSNLTSRYHKQNNSLSLSSEAHKSQPTLLEMDLKKFYHI